MDAITYPCWNLKLNHISKKGHSKASLNPSMIWLKPKSYRNVFQGCVEKCISNKNFLGNQPIKLSQVLPSANQIPLFTLLYYITMMLLWQQEIIPISHN